MNSTVTLREISSAYLPGEVKYAVLAPDGSGALPLCVLLLGAGGTRESLVELQRVFAAWWTEGSVPRMVIATPTPGNDYSMWDSFLANDFVPALRSEFDVNDVTVLAGISGGGYGALKLAFAEPGLFAAVAAMQPMLEPGFREADVGARNRLHRSAGVPAGDAALWEANNPANRVRANAERVRESGLAIYLEAGDHDFLNAHDGTEFLHRVLWDLDLSHEYHLVRGADHGGPTMRGRMRAMFAWFGALWNPPPADPEVERSAIAWLEAGMQGRPPAGATTTEAFLRFLRARFEPLHAQAAESDATAHRRFGRF